MRISGGTVPVVNGLDALLFGRIDGVDRLVFPEHNIVMYHLLSTVGHFLGRALALCHEDTLDCITVRSRFPFLLLFLCAIAIGMAGLKNWFAFDQPTVLAATKRILTAPVGGGKE